MREIRQILASVPRLTLLDLDQAGLPYQDEEDALEPHPTFEQNARSKAAYFRVRSGLPTVADDSGLEVHGLGGAPGVRSKRFAKVPDAVEEEARDRANTAHLLELLRGMPADARTARYVCAVALDDGGAMLTLRGESPGWIAEAPRGSGGFGYDPVFVDQELGLTFAELSAEEKNARSHRGAAFRQLAARLLERAGA